MREMSNSNDLVRKKTTFFFPQTEVFKNYLLENKMYILENTE